MAIDSRLLALLRCPLSGQALTELDGRRLGVLNQAIARGELRSEDGQTVTQPLSAALLTADAGRVYRIDDGIPVLLGSESILPGTTLAAAV